MQRIFSRLFAKKGSQIPHLKLCPHHSVPDLKKNTEVPTLPYSTDQCKSCHEHMCHACSEQHVSQHCIVELGIIKQLGVGVEKDFTMGDLIKVDIDNLHCICGKKLGSNAAICAACGMASCSEACHKVWEQMGNCIFGKNFYSLPQNVSMRSILFSNIYKVREANMKEWAITNRSSTNMVCCYASSDHEYVFLQRGFRNYGRPNDELIVKMETMPRTIDYYTHYDRRCECQCSECQGRGVHSSNNCQSCCHNFDYQHMIKEVMSPQNHKQCTCTCEFCSSGLVVVSHRLIDCMPFCKRSSYTRS